MALPPADRSASTRYVDDGRRAGKRALYREQYDNSWAVVIGIDRYADASYRPLRFAAADAVAMARALIEHRHFPREHVFLIAMPGAPLRHDLQAWLRANRTRLGSYQRSATKRQIERLLFDALASGARRADDRVLIYFAGHGRSRAPDNRPYLVPSDAHAGRWREHIDLKDLLQECSYLAAKHVLYVLDACHSGLADTRSIAQDTQFVPKMLSRAARQCLTAGTREQRVDDHWRGRHSPFTGCLLDLLGDRSERGDSAAMDPEDSEALPVSTVFARLRKRVGGKGTTSGQLPALFSAPGDDGGEFVFSPRIAPLSLDDQAALARQLVDEVGRPLDESAPIQFAAALWSRVLRESPADAGRRRREARREHARAQLLLGRPREALRELDGTLEHDADARLLRAIAQLRLDHRKQAAAELEKLVELAPGHRYADWAQRAIPVARRPRGTRHALLIGVEAVTAMPGARLSGCRNDIAALGELLSDPTLGFKVTPLVGRAATVDAIRAQFARFARQLTIDDAFVCYIIGQGYLDGDVVVYPSADLDLNGDRRLTEDYIDRAIRRIPARDMLLVTDGHHLAPASDAEKGSYRFLHACGQREKRWEIRTPDGKDRGAFTYAFENAVRALGNASIAQVMAEIRAELAGQRLPQTPGHTGSGAARLFQSPPVALEIIELAELSHGPFATERIGDFTDWLTRTEELAAHENRAISMAPLWLAVGHARLARRDDRLAIPALERADLHARSSKTPCATALLPLIRAQLQCDRYAEAFETWREWRTSPRSETVRAAHAPQVAALGALLEARQTGNRRALLVATDRGGSAGWGSRLGQVRELLIDRFGISAKNIDVLVNPGKQAVLAAFRVLAGAARSASAFFLYIGPGFDGAEVWLSTTDRRGQVSANLGVAELSAQARGSAHLTAALLLTQYQPPHGSSRAAQQAPAAMHAELGIATLVVAPYMQRPAQAPHPSGVAQTPGIRALDGSPVVPDSAEAIEPAQVAQILNQLALNGDPSLSLEAWRRAFAAMHGSRLRGKADAALLPYLAQRGQALKLLRDLEQAALPGMLGWLDQLTRQPEDVAEAWLQIAIIQAQRGRDEDAIAAVNASLARHRADPLDVTGPARPATSAGGSLDAHYHRGRIQLALKDYTDAEAELRFTVGQQPTHARAHYYRARAIRALLETDLAKLRQESIHQYMKHGAPLGIDREVAEQRPEPSTRTPG